jgi:hypothetical protein
VMRLKSLTSVKGGRFLGPVYCEGLQYYHSASMRSDSQVMVSVNESSSFINDSAIVLVGIVMLLCLRTPA